MEPLTIDVGDIVQTIVDGEVDTQENPFTNIRLFGFVLCDKKKSFRISPEDIRTCFSISN